MIEGLKTVEEPTFGQTRTVVAPGQYLACVFEILGVGDPIQLRILFSPQDLDREPVRGLEDMLIEAVRENIEISLVSARVHTEDAEDDTQERLRAALATFGWGPRTGQIVFARAADAPGWTLGNGVVITPWHGKEVPDDPDQALSDIEAAIKEDSP